MFLSLLFSFGAGQTAHLNVLAVPTPAATSVTAPMAQIAKKPTGICDITLSFFDGQSNQLKTSEVWINPGGSTTLALPWPGGARFVSAGTGLFYGEVVLGSDSDPSCQILPSLDLTNFDGSSTVVVPLQGGRFAAALN